MKEYMKRTDYTVEYECVEPGTKVHNFLENADYVTDEKQNVVITGMLGEKWVVSEEKLRKTYDVNNEQPLIPGNTGRVSPKPDGNTIFAEKTYVDTVVETAWGTKLEAHPEDYIVYANKDGKPDLEDRWVVSRYVFDSTYKEVDYHTHDNQRSR